jgi:hypothetical protein
MEVRSNQEIAARHIEPQLRLFFSDAGASTRQALGLLPER